MTGVTVRSALGYAWRFPLTTAAVTMAVLLTGMAVVTDVNVIDVNLSNQRISRSELDELAVAWALVFTAYGVDLVTRVKRRAERIEAEQLRVVHVTMRTVREIVGDGLSELRHLQTKGRGSLSAEGLATLDECIRVTVARLDALDELKAYFEKRMPTAPGRDAERRDES